jgi:putative membrane protein
VSTDRTAGGPDWLADNVAWVAASLAFVSVVVVVAAARQAVPTAFLPRSEPLLALAPHLNAAVVAVATVTVLAGVRAIRRGDVRRHRRLMLASFGLFVGFLALYLYKVSLVGPAPFPGPDGVYRWLYLPVLAVHVLLAVASLPAVYYTLLLAATRPVETLPSTPHRRVGRVAASLWLVSFLLGIAVYGMLYVVPW